MYPGYCNPVDLPRGHQRFSLNTVHIVKLASNRKTDAKTSRVLDRHPGKGHPGKLNDAEDDKQQNGEGDDKLYHRLAPFFSF